jgi:hypothetical protein
MEFSEEQKDIIRGWVKAGDGLSEIQRKLVSEFDATMTYMDVRFLVLDLKVDIKEDDEPEAEEPEAAADDTAAASEAGGSGGVTVEVDVLMRPGALISGTVRFSDGVTAVWVLDQAGRLGIEPSQEGYHPSEEDNAEFVNALKAEIAKKGL